jgi:hypothetical protein
MYNVPLSELSSLNSILYNSTTYIILYSRVLVFYRSLFFR